MRFTGFFFLLDRDPLTNNLHFVMQQERVKLELEVLDVVLNDPPITYTVRFYGSMSGHMIVLKFELPTTIVIRTVASWAQTELGARLWVFPRTHPIVRFAVQNTKVDVHDPALCAQCRRVNSPGGTRFALSHSVDKVWLTVPRNFDFQDLKRNEDFLRCVVTEYW